MEDFLSSVNKQFRYYKSLGEKTMDQLSEENLFWQPNTESNSIAVIVKHISGNMLSRWTKFMTEDGEKPWRDRDDEFELTDTTKNEVLERWDRGWACLFGALSKLSYSDLEKIIHIRNMGHTVVEAINRQQCHYAYHIGQIVFLGKIILSDNWDTLSIAKGNSVAYNEDKFSKEKSKKHFTEDL